MLNGIKRTITSVTSPTVATISGTAMLYEPATKFYIVGVDSDFIVTPTLAELFPDFIASSIDGFRLFWDSGESAKISYILNTGDVEVSYMATSEDSKISSGPLSIENPKAYARFEEDGYTDRFQWRTIWSLPDQPRRFGATATGKISPSNNVLTLDYPIRSIWLGGGEILLTGMSAGNLPCGAIYYDGLRMLIGDSAITGFYEDILANFENAVSLEGIGSIGQESSL